jgi:hypothetical protein
MKEYKIRPGSLDQIHAHVRKLEEMLHCARVALDAAENAADADQFQEDAWAAEEEISTIRETLRTLGLPIRNYTDLEIVQMRGQCNRVRLGMTPDDPIFKDCAKEGLIQANCAGSWSLTERGQKFCFDLSGSLP